jgi:hypothetical protein
MPQHSSKMLATWIKSRRPKEWCHPKERCLTVLSAWNGYIIKYPYCKASLTRLDEITKFVWTPAKEEVSPSDARSFQIQYNTPCIRAAGNLIGSSFFIWFCDPPCGHDVINVSWRLLKLDPQDHTIASHAVRYSIARASLGNMELL